MSNSVLHKASKDKMDEFYTRIEDVEKELAHYGGCFEGATVLCNCDEFGRSAFARFFEERFEELGLKRLICTWHVPKRVEDFGTEDGPAVAYRVDMDGPGIVRRTPLKGDGDFRSKECVEALEEADVVVTNPPFSLFREMLSLVLRHGKRFLLIGTQNVIGYKEVFPLLKANMMWLGCNNGDMSFRVPQDCEPRATRYWVDEDGQKWRSLGNVSWYTNMEHDGRHTPLELTERYDPERYPRYGNRDAIEVPRFRDIPCDYLGEMGVPITFMTVYCPDQFRIEGFRKGDDGKDLYVLEDGGKRELFSRILIRRRSA